MPHEKRICQMAIMECVIHAMVASVDILRDRPSSASVTASKMIFFTKTNPLSKKPIDEPIYFVL